VSAFNKAQDDEELGEALKRARDETHATRIRDAATGRTSLWTKHEKQFGELRTMAASDAKDIHKKDLGASLDQIDELIRKLQDARGIIANRIAVEPPVAA